MTQLYFAYGSNLDPAQMRLRCPGSTSRGPGVLPAHRLVFAGASGNWDGFGVATVLPSDAHRVPGFLYALTPHDFTALDRFEGSYDRRVAEVETEVGATPVWIYVRRESEPRAPPSPEYLAIMAHAYGRLGYDLASLLGALRI